MALTEVFTITLTDRPTAMVGWGDGYVLLGYDNGLLEVRELGTGGVVAQGYSPFDNRGGSGGTKVARAGHCRSGLGILAGSFGNTGISVASIKVDPAKQSMDIGETRVLPVVGRPARDDEVMEVKLIGPDGQPVEYAEQAPPARGELATCPTGGMVTSPFKRYAQDRDPSAGEIAGAVLAAWFDVTDAGIITFTKLAAQAAAATDEPRKNDYAQFSGDLRWVKDQEFRDLRHVYDRSKAMPVSTTSLPLQPDPYNYNFLEYVRDDDHNNAVHYADADGNVVQKVYEKVEEPPVNT